MASVLKTYPMGGRYTLYAYVCGAGCVVHADVEGTLSFMQVFMKRPAECRYAIVGAWDVAKQQHRIFVWDMHDTRSKRTGSHKIYPPPKPLRYFTDVDQAIMATLMLYEQ